jgi:hypothetical protein
MRFEWLLKTISWFIIYDDWNVKKVVVVANWFNKSFVVFL